MYTALYISLCIIISLARKPRIWISLCTSIILSLIPRPLPDFISQPWPGDEATSYYGVSYFIMNRDIDLHGKSGLCYVLSCRFDVHHCFIWSSNLFLLSYVHLRVEYNSRSYPHQATSASFFSTDAKNKVKLQCIRSTYTVDETIIIQGNQGNSYIMHV